MEELKHLRMQSSLKQQEMADKLGITRSAYASYENGIREPKFELLKKMADFFNVSIDFLLGHSKDEASQEASVNGRKASEVTNIPQKESAWDIRERKLVYGFRLLNEAGRERVENTLDFEVDFQNREQMLRHQRQQEGIEAARERGVTFGRPSIPLPENFPAQRDLWLAGKTTLDEAAKACGISRSLFYDKARPQN